MFEVHNFLGPVTPLLDFGTEQQKAHYLPRLACGELMGSFALTEPGAGADPSRLAMSARRQDDRYVINGVKWPITNIVYGGLCILVVKLDGEHLPEDRNSGMIIFEVPPSDSVHFKMIRNQLSAFSYLWNARFRLSDYEVPVAQRLGPPGQGLAQAFSSLAKGRGGIGVNSAAKIFRLLAQVILDPSRSVNNDLQQRFEPGGWTSVRSTFGKPLRTASRVQAWIGRAVCHGLAARALGDLCFRLAANGVRDETQGMVAKVYATNALVNTALKVFQLQGGRCVHKDQRALALRRNEVPPSDQALIENYVGENMHEFLIASVYEGPNTVLADVGAPNAMTRDIRARYLEPIGLAEAQACSTLLPKLRFAWFTARSVLRSLRATPDSLDGMRSMFPDKRRYVLNALRRQRVLGRRLLLLVVRYQKAFMDQSFLLGDEGGIFDQLCYSLASLVFVSALDQPVGEYLQVAAALDLEAEVRLYGRTSTPRLQTAWADIGRTVMSGESTLFSDLIADIEVTDIPLDPRSVSRYI
jgi:alkylation response protein AidB-like acyl-CoA dehydrogenase